MSHLLVGHAYSSPDGKLRIQALSEHCRNVAVLCSQSCAPLGLEKLGYLTGILHDMGKAHPLVQARLLGRTTQKYNHSSSGTRWLWLTYGESPDIDHRLAAQMAALAIGDHHSSRSDIIAPDGSEPWKELHIDSESAREMYEPSRAAFFEQCVSEKDVHDCFELAAAEVAALHKKIAQNVCMLDKPHGTVTLQMTLGLCQRFLYSALIDADWTDTACFEAGMPLPEFDKPRWPQLAAKADEFFQALECRKPIDALRRKISQQCTEAAEAARSGIYRLYLPTGGGKTYSGLRYCLHAAQRRGAPTERIFYFSPYCSILGQNADEFRKVLGSEFVLEHHSNVIYEDNSTDEDDGVQKTLLAQTQRWQGVPFIATTMVQLLNTLFAAPRQNVRRMASLANSILWFDEIQSLPTRHVHSFNLAVNFLAEYLGCTVILCTATQPPLATLDFPLHLAEPLPDIVPDFELKFEQFRRTSIVPLAGEFTAEGLAEFAASKLNSNCSILVILNTRGAVERVYNELKTLLAGRTELYCLTTYLCPKHRSDVINVIREKLAALKSESGERFICVSTQLIESGVDLSFDCVIRSLTGLPSVAQAAGRCNRHAESACRPVYLADCAPLEKSIGKSQALAELEHARRATKQLLRRSTDGADLLSPASIQAYYSIFYVDPWVKKAMQAPLSKRDDTLLNLFSSNCKSQLAYYERTGKKLKGNWQLVQAFGTAEQSFHALDDNSAAVVVPYGSNGKELTALLLSNAHLNTKVLRQAQRYTVSLLPYQIHCLEKNGAIIKAQDGAILLLDERYYNSETGVCLEAQPLDELFY